MSETSTLSRFATLGVAQSLSQLETSESGLSSLEAKARLSKFGSNSFRSSMPTWLSVMGRQLKSPLLLLLAATVVIAWLLGESSNTVVIAVILLLSVGLGFWSEYRAELAAQTLHAKISHKATVLRDGALVQVDVKDLVPGDIVRLSPGNIVPADMRLIEVSGLECDESVATGESLPVEKSASDSAAELDNCALMGTVVHSGLGTGIVVATGMNSSFGQIIASLNSRAGETEFQLGLRKFSSFLLYTSLALTSFILIVNLLLQRPLVDSLLFSLAIAIGMTPQLLPAVVSVGLAHGARRLMKKDILVKRLISVEDLGDIDLLVTDKTGTLTEGKVTLDSVEEVSGNCALFAALAIDVDFEAARANPDLLGAIDKAIWQNLGANQDAVSKYQKLQTIPFDSNSRRSTVVVSADGGQKVAITKGAAEEILRLTGSEESSKLEELMRSGKRVLAVASKQLAQGEELNKEPAGYKLDGLLAFSDTVKPETKASLEALASLGIAVKIATGDNPVVAQAVCEQVGLRVNRVVTGAELEKLSPAEFDLAAREGTIFARVSPEQKAELVRSLRHSGSSVGFMGDGINDAVALHAADVGISVEGATDVAKDAADIVLLEKDLGVLAGAIVEGRRVFSNTMKYILMITSSNFGNMFSMAAGSIFLKFMPMMPSQVLLNDMLYDTSQLMIPGDRVDEESLRRPSQWSIKQIQRFMLTFGPASSIFDLATFGVLIWVFNATESVFQTGWFLESLATEILIVFVIRTRRIPFFKSRPSKSLTLAVLAILTLAWFIPFSPLAPELGFTPLPVEMLLALGLIVLCYLGLVEVLKHFYYRTPVQKREIDPNRHGRKIRRSIGFSTHR